MAAKLSAAAVGISVIAFSTPLGSMLTAGSASDARKPTSPPAGATMQCKDGTYSFAVSRNGACWGHGGVAKVLSSGKAAPKTPAKPATKTPAVKPAAKKPAVKTPAKTTKKQTTKKQTTKKQTTKKVSTKSSKSKG